MPLAVTGGAEPYVKENCLAGSSRPWAGCRLDWSTQRRGCGTELTFGPKCFSKLEHGGTIISLTMERLYDIIARKVGETFFLDSTGSGAHLPSALGAVWHFSACSGALIKPENSAMIDGRHEVAPASALADGMPPVELADARTSTADNATIAVGCSGLFPVIALPCVELNPRAFLLQSSAVQVGQGRSYHQIAHLFLGRVRAVETDVAKYNHYLRGEVTYIEVFGRDHVATSIAPDGRSSTAAFPRYVAQLQNCGIDFDLAFVARADDADNDDIDGTGPAFSFSYSLLGGEPLPCRCVWPGVCRTYDLHPLRSCALSVLPWAVHWSPIALPRSRPHPACHIFCCCCCTT